MDGGDWQDSGDPVSSMTVGSHTIRYKPVTGWIPPITEQLNITPGSNQITREYHLPCLEDMDQDGDIDGVDLAIPAV